MQLLWRRVVETGVQVLLVVRWLAALQVSLEVQVLGLVEALRLRLAAELPHA